MNMKNYDIVIVGSGPAGISCAIYLQRSNLKIALIEKSTPGGRMLQASDISNYPGLKGSGVDLANAMFSMIDFSKIDFLIDEVINIKKENDNFNVYTKNDEIKSQKVILATGFINKPLENTNEADFVGRGISYCALCDAPLVKDKTILCFGSGKKAIKEINYLSTLAKKTYLITNAAEEINKNIEVLNNAKIKHFNGTFKLQSVLLTIDEKEINLDVDYVFLFNGFIPGSQIVQDLNITNEQGLIEINDDCETSIKGLYAIGDINTKDIKQVATAVGDGAYVAAKILR